MRFAAAEDGDLDWSPDTLGDFSSFLEMAFALNVLFSTWSRPGAALTEWLIQRARRDQENRRVELEETEVRERIFAFQQKCDRAIPRWRWAAGSVAFLILAMQFLLADSSPVANWGMVLAGMTVLPLAGVALFLGVPAFNCARKNRRELNPPLRRLSQLNVRQIGDRITNSKAVDDTRGDRDEH